MASIIRRSGLYVFKHTNSYSVSPVACRLLSSSKDIISKDSNSSGQIVTHTGQSYAASDYRNLRFTGLTKNVNKSFAIDLIAEQPVIVCDKRVVSSDSGGKLGHPRVFINLDAPGTHTCLYSGQRFVHKKYYDEKTMGKSITYEQYVEQY